MEADILKENKRKKPGKSSIKLIQHRKNKLGTEMEDDLVRNMKSDTNSRRGKQ